MFVARGFDGWEATTGLNQSTRISKTTAGSFEAKTLLASLLDRVAKGEKITITRHGVPAAVLVPVAEIEVRLSHKDIVYGMRAVRNRVKPDEMSIKDMISEGRRH